MTVRDATEADILVLVDFNVAMARHVGEQVDRVVVERGVMRVLTDGVCGFYLVAESDGVIVGQLFVSRTWSDWEAGWFWGPQSLWVDPGHRRRGVARALIDALHAQLVDSPEVRGLTFIVEDGNDAARDLYESLGATALTYRVWEYRRARG